MKRQRALLCHGRAVRPKHHEGRVVDKRLELAPAAGGHGAAGAQEHVVSAPDDEAVAGAIAPAVRVVALRLVQRLAHAAAIVHKQAAVQQKLQLAGRQGHRACSGGGLRRVGKGL